jgi:hypothetical protein
MGQLIAFPARQRPAHPHRAAALQLVYVLAYVLGFFLVGPVLALVALSGLFVGEPLTSAGALVLLALLWPLCAAARRRIV